MIYAFPHRMKGCPALGAVTGLPGPFGVSRPDEAGMDGSPQDAYATGVPAACEGRGR